MASLIESSEAYSHRAYIETRYGYFDMDKPQFDARDIAHALGQLARYNGHTYHFYSVAEHSVKVADLMRDLSLGNPLEGLLHDASEAYLSDVPSPFKQCFPDWRQYDARVERAVREHYGLPLTKTEGCKTADWLALFIEASQLMRTGGDHYADPNGLRKQALELAARYPVRGYGPVTASSILRRELYAHGIREVERA